MRSPPARSKTPAQMPRAALPPLEKSQRTSSVPTRLFAASNSGDENRNASPALASKPRLARGATSTNFSVPPFSTTLIV